MRKLLTAVAIVLTVLCVPAKAAHADALDKAFDKAQPSTPIQVHGDAVEYFNAEQKVVGTGHVSIDYEGAKLNADKITVYLEAKRAVAEGHVVLVQNGSTFRGERGEYDYARKVGNVANMDAEIAPSFYGKAREIRRVSEDHYQAVDSHVTTCCGDRPLYKIKAQQIDIYPGKKLTVRNALLVVNDVPVLWLPFFETYFVDFERFPVQLVPGKNHEWGAFLLSKWRYHVVERPELTSRGNILVDWRERRGMGGGVENFYRGDAVGHGVLRGYYLNDDRPFPGDPEERYRGQWRHQSKIGEDTTLTAEINKLSDRNIVRDFFFSEEYERDTQPDNYLSVITAKPEYSLSFLERHRLNDFSTVVERNPQVRFDTHTRPFMDTPFYFRQEVQFDALKKEFADPGGDIDTIRQDVRHTLSYAGHAGPVSVVPHMSFRETFYSRDAGGDRSHGRGSFEAGVDVNMRFFKTYDWYLHSWGLDYNRIRHVFTPEMSYNRRPNPTVKRTKLQQFDALDALDKENVYRFSFEQKLQTQEHLGGLSTAELRTRDIVRVMPFFDLDQHTRRLSNIGLDAEWRPYSWLGIDTDLAYDAVTRRVYSANFDVYLAKRPVRLSVGHRYYRGESNQMTANLSWTLNPQWTVNLYERYEFVGNISREFEGTVSKTWDCVITDFTYNHRPGDGVRPGEDAFFVIVRLKAFPEASFRMTKSYDHPKPGTLEPAP